MLSSSQPMNVIENGSISTDIIRLGGVTLPVTINQGNSVIIDLASADLANTNIDFLPAYTSYFPISGPKIDFGPHVGQPLVAKLQGNVDSSQNDGIFLVEYLSFTSEIDLGTVTKPIVRSAINEFFVGVNIGFVNAAIIADGGVKIRLTSSRGNITVNTLKLILNNEVSAI